MVDSQLEVNEENFKDRINRVARDFNGNRGSNLLPVTPGRGTVIVDTQTGHLLKYADTVWKYVGSYHIPIDYRRLLPRYIELDVGRGSALGLDLWVVG